MKLLKWILAAAACALAIHVANATPPQLPANPPAAVTNCPTLSFSDAFYNDSNFINVLSDHGPLTGGLKWTTTNANGLGLGYNLNTPPQSQWYTTDSTNGLTMDMHNFYQNATNGGDGNWYASVLDSAAFANGGGSGGSPTGFLATPPWYFECAIWIPPLTSCDNANIAGLWPSIAFYTDPSKSPQGTLGEIDLFEGYSVFYKQPTCYTHVWNGFNQLSAAGTQLNLTTDLSTGWHIWGFWFDSVGGTMHTYLDGTQVQTIPASFFTDSVGHTYDYTKSPWYVVIANGLGGGWQLSMSPSKTYPMKVAYVGWWTGTPGTSTVPLPLPSTATQWTTFGSPSVVIGGNTWSLGSSVIGNGGYALLENGQAVVPGAAGYAIYNDPTLGVVAYNCKGQFFQWDPVNINWIQLSTDPSGVRRTQETVPNVSNGTTTEAAAMASLAANSLVGWSNATASSATVPAGDVISQSIASGTQTDIWHTVKLTISTGPASGTTSVFDEEFNYTGAPSPANWTTPTKCGGSYIVLPANSTVNGTLNMVTDGHGPYSGCAGGTVPNSDAEIDGVFATQAQGTGTTTDIRASMKSPSITGNDADFEAFTTNFYSDPVHGGEIDFYEQRWGASIHFPVSGVPQGGSITIPMPTLDSNYHEFGAIVTQNQIQILLDGQVFHTFTPSDLPSGGYWPFNNGLNVRCLMHADHTAIPLSSFPLVSNWRYVRIRQ